MELEKTSFRRSHLEWDHWKEKRHIHTQKKSLGKHHPDEGRPRSNSQKKESECPSQGTKRNPGFLAYREKREEGKVLLWGASQKMRRVWMLF